MEGEPLLIAMKMNKSIHVGGLGEGARRQDGGPQGPPAADQDQGPRRGVLQGLTPAGTEQHDAASAAAPAFKKVSCLCLLLKAFNGFSIEMS